MNTIEDILNIINKSEIRQKNLLKKMVFCPINHHINRKKQILSRRGKEVQINESVYGDNFVIVENKNEEIMIFTVQNREEMIDVFNECAEQYGNKNIIGVINGKIIKSKISEPTKVMFVPANTMEL